MEHERNIYRRNSSDSSMNKRNTNSNRNER